MRPRAHRAMLLAGMAFAAGGDASAALAINAADLRSRLDAISRQAPGASGYQVVELGREGNRVLFSRREDDPRKLASNMKLFTTATALDRLGADGRIKTLVKAAQKPGDNGVLDGDLYLVGGGDPTLAARGMRTLARQVAAAGVERVSGDLVADDSIFDHKRGVLDTGFEANEDIAPLAGLVYGGSSYQSNPALEAARELAKRLDRKKIRVSGGIALGKLPKPAEGGKPLAAFGSPTIAAIIDEINVTSNNFFAEMLAKLVATLDGGRGTTAAGTDEIEQFAQSVGSDVEALDGSGLTDNNRSSPRNVVRLLDAMHSHEDAGAFYGSLPVAGQEGTLDDRMEGTAAAGECRAKTGTINYVSTLSGYCELGRGGSGNLVAFSLLINSVSDYKAAQDIQDRMVAEIARYEP